MASPGPSIETLGRIAYEFSLIQPYLPTYFHLLVSALFPIYAGAHASLARPRSAAKPLKRKKSSRSEDDNDDLTEIYQRMEGLSPSDAILYPLLTGCMLAGLYFLIKWLQDPAILNKILNWYLSIFGIFSITRLLSDSTTSISSFVFPTSYTDGGRVWKVKHKERYATLQSFKATGLNVPAKRLSPLPGVLGTLPLPNRVTKYLWVVRSNITQPPHLLEAYVRGLFQVKLAFGLQGLYSFMFAITAILYFNLIDKPWWLTNLLGFSFSYSALQLMSPTTFWTGTMVLTSLFFYDIYFVFFTPMMITVATKLDIPAKLLFPRPSGLEDDPSKKAHAMLGLGDVVLPGIMIGLALRFDLYLFYLKKQKREKLAGNETPNTILDKAEDHSGEHSKSVQAATAYTIVKAPYRPAIGRWGERFWLGREHSAETEGGSFPKVYFHASVIGYIVGMLCTLGAMHVYKHGQPALLYLVPGVLCSLWGRALISGDIRTMWEYTEVEDEKSENCESDSKKKDKNTTEVADSIAKAVSTPLAEDEVSDATSRAVSAATGPTAKLETGGRIVYFCITSPHARTSGSPSKAEQKKRILEGRVSSEGWIDLKDSRMPGSSSSSNHSTPARRSSDIQPAEKRRRLE